jgi:hypothetical protein
MRRNSNNIGPKPLLSVSHVCDYTFRFKHDPWNGMDMASKEIRIMGDAV